MFLTRVAQIILAAGAVCGAANAATVFNFDNDPLGTATNFTDTVGGLSATFSSAADPGGFVVLPSMFETLTGNVLGDPGPAGLDGLALTVNFSQDLAAVTLNFATSDFNTASPFTLTAFEGSTPVGSISSTGQFLDGFSFPEGEIAFSGSAFNQIVLSSTATDLVIDNLTVATVPEPSGFALLTIGLLAVIIPGFCNKFARRSRAK